MAIVVERKGTQKTFTITPKRSKDGRGLIGVELRGKVVPVGAKEALSLAITRPPIVVKSLVVGLGRWIRREVDPEFAGPVRITSELARAVRRSIPDWLAILGALSAYLGAFNLIPFPALDGGRLMFLGYELATRRKPNARVEAHVHIVGMMMLLCLMLWVTIFNDLNIGGSR